MPRSYAVSLEWKLPLLMTGLFAAGLAALLAFTYWTLSARAEFIVRDRIAFAAGEAALMVAPTLRRSDIPVTDGVAGGVAPVIADVERRLKALTREDVRLRLRDVRGGYFRAPGLPSTPPARRDSSAAGLTHTRASGERLLAAEAPVPGTPWLVVLEVPERWVLQRPRGTVARIALFALPLLLVGTLLSWLLGRRITRPLRALVTATEEVAAGTYEHAVPAPTRDEVGRLAARFDDMARQVADAHRELEARVKEAESANKAKSDFLAMMSHELRTPLNAIGGYAQLMEMGLHGPVTSEQKDALARIARSQTHLLALINDILSFARLDAGQVEFAMTDVPMRETLAGMEALVAPQLRARGLSFELVPCEAPLAARADADKLRQVVLNLLSNAIKYTPEGGAITLACDADERAVVVLVRDTGPGIPPAQLAEIFEPFVQGNRALNRPHEGVGLGLTISRDLARGMGGELTVESEVGRGSTFRLTLVRARGRDPETTAGHAATRGGRATLTPTRA